MRETATSAQSVHDQRRFDRRPRNGFDHSPAGIHGPAGEYSTSTNHGARAGAGSAQSPAPAQPNRRPTPRQAGVPEDLLQDALLKAYVGFGSFHANSNLRAWLNRILTNTYVNDYRKRQRQPRIQSADDITDGQLVAHASHASTGLRSAETEALESLPYRDVAEIMGSPLGTVTSRLHRGRRQLRRVLAKTDSTRRQA